VQTRTQTRTHPFSLPVIFTAAVLVAYGLPIFLGWFSFYGDDWIYIYNYHLAGSLSFPEFVAWDRPHSAWIYMAASALFGENVLPYHLLLLAQRWISVFLFWKILELVWPASNRLISWAVLLFAIYPGFKQQPIAVQYILHFASLDLCLFSIWCMLKSAAAETVQKRFATVLTILGVAAALLAHFSCEYFIGLEFVRPLLLLFFLRNSMKRNAPLRQALTRWLPYLASLIVFLVWRIFIFSFQTYQPKLIGKFTDEPINAIMEMARKVFTDLVTVTISVWRKAVNLPSGLNNQLIWGLLVAGFFLLAVWLLNQRDQTVEFHQKTSCWDQPETQMFVTGVIALLAAGIPFWITMINIELNFPWDRPSISFSPGIALLFSVVISWLFKPWFQTVAVALLAVVAIGSHFTNALVYRDEARKMNDYFWQLTWRAPQLTPGTILVSENIPLDRYSDNDLTPVVNWQYAPELKGYTYQYKYFDLDLRAETFFNPVQADQPITHDYRSHHFESDSNHVLALYYKKDGCLWVIGADEKNYPNLPQNIADLAELSNPDLILASAEQVQPPAPIGAEPAADYCYYFQKINLAFQQGDPAAALESAEQAYRAELQPEDPLDQLPQIEAFALAGEWEKALELSGSITAKADYQPFFCERISALSTETDPAAQEAFLLEAGCSK